MLLPRWTGTPLLPRPDRGGAPAILFLDDRDHIRFQLHNFFEANGYNLLEAADLNEALAVSKVHDGPLDLLIAEARLADALADDLRRVHPNAAVLKIVDAEAGASEIRRPFTQVQLLDRVQSLLSRTGSTASSAACQDSIPEQVT
jgi:DNA-binding response OmpR family regulator